MAKYYSFRELGLKVKRINPRYAKYTVEDAGRDAAAQLGIEVGDDRDFGERAWDDLGQTLKEDLKGTISAITSPVETAKGIGLLAGGASDIWLGTDFVDEEVEEVARGAGKQYMDEISDWENRPVRALSNIAIAGGPIGAISKLGKASTLGKIGRGAGRALELADPLTAVGATGKGIAKLATHPIRSAVSKGTKAVTPEGDKASKQFLRSSLGLYSGQGEEAVNQVSKRFRNKESRDVINKQLLEGSDASLIAEDSFLRSYKKNLDDANKAYKAAKNNLKESGIWDQEYEFPINFRDPITVNARAELGLASIFNTVFENRDIQIRMKEVRQRLTKDGPFTVVGFKPVPIGDKLAVSAKDMDIIKKIYDEKSNVIRKQRHVTFGNLDSLKKGLRDQLRTIDPEGTTPVARSTLSGLVSEIGGILRTNPDYKRIMRAYEERARLSELIDENFSINPESFELEYMSRRGERLSMPDLGERLKKSFDSNSTKAANKRELIEHLEGATNNQDIGDLVLGARMQPLTANNLMGKSETARAIRQIVGITGALVGLGGVAGGLGAAASLGLGAVVGAAAAIPAWILLSPRSSTRLLSHLASKGFDIGDTPAGKKNKEIANLIEVEGDRWRAATRSGGVSPDTIVDDLKNSGLTVRGLAKMIAGKTMSTAVSPTMRRVGAQTQRIGEEQKAQGQPNIFRLLGGRR